MKRRSPVRKPQRNQLGKEGSWWPEAAADSAVLSVVIKAGVGLGGLAGAGTVAVAVVGPVEDWVVDFSVVSLKAFIALSRAAFLVMPRTQLTFCWMFCLYWSRFPAR